VVAFHAAYCYSVSRFIVCACLCVYVLGTQVSAEKTDELIEIPFGWVRLIWNHALDVCAFVHKVASSSDND